VEFAASVAPAQKLQRRSFERVGFADDRYFLGVAVEMATVVGSLSGGLLTPFIIGS
jgi:hypothetical protein